MTKALDSAWTTIATFVPKLIGFILILIIGLIIARFIAKVLERCWRRSGSTRPSNAEVVFQAR